MKTFFKTVFITLALAGAALTGCKDDMEYSNGNVASATPVWPEDGSKVELFNSSVATLDFQWEAANTAGAPYYQVVFYAGDRATEVYRIAPAERQLQVSVPHRTLNVVAGLAGIAPNASGDVYWAVASVKGTVEDISETRKLTLQSYQAFDDLPANLYVAGAGAEGGTNVAAAPQFRETGKGVYEAYTELLAGGEFYFTNRNTPGDGRIFTVADSFLVEADGAPATPLTVAASGVYAITLNFVTAEAAITPVTDVRYFAPDADTSMSMNYDGYGKWSLHVTLGNLTSDNNRYKFLANVGGTDRSWGCSAPGGQGNPPQILEGDYFYVYQNAHSAADAAERARYAYRHMLELSNQEVDLILDMSSSNDHYAHVVDAGDLTVYPVEQLNEPAADASVALSKVAGSSLSFSWQPSSGTGPTPKYTLVFYSDAEGANEVGSAPAENNGYDATATVLHSAMEPIAAAAGISPEGTGELWWSVRTTVLAQSEMAATPPRKLTVTRLPGIPAAMYITGAASEGGVTLSDALAMKKTSDGVFEIYTQLATGDYSFVDGNTGTPRQFSVSGGTAIVEGGATSATAGIYKIELNFNANEAVYTEILSVNHWLCHKSELTPMEYNGHGTWILRNKFLDPTFIGNWGNGGAIDNRYQLRAKFAETVDECWGPVNSSEDGAPSSIDPTNTYFFLKSYTAFDQWGPKFKYHASVYGKFVDIYVDMNAENPTHRFEIKEVDMTAHPVEQLSAPADNASVTLNKTDGLTFSWQQPSSSGTLIPKYTVVFYSDATGTTEIGTAPADGNSEAATATVPHSAIENFAAAANIPAAGTGDIWWSVRTTVLTQSAMAAASPRKLTVTRLSGIPDAVYITGAASEGGATLGSALPMKRTAAGVFEIYTKLTTGAYSFVDGNTGTPQQFSLNGAEIVEDGTISATAGIYKIVLDFNAKVATYREITKVEFFHPWGGQRVTLTYTSNGVWAGSTTSTSGWWSDERYRFKVTDNVEIREWYGIESRNSPPTGNPDFYYMKEGLVDATGNTEWMSDNMDNNMWKIPDSCAPWDSHSYNITFSVKADEPYTHMITCN
ncbi:MAG: SusE domain-containing protein [Prevotellaceae bacterium]|jgi:hypothetical protein|nr:SusE domain-containing protein [Prevotellaceae bacterium]